MKEMLELIRSAKSQWVYRHAMSTLTGHALGAAKNTFSYFERSHFVSGKYPGLAYFCITHATEEAVVSLIQTARQTGYEPDIKKFNHTVHRHKAVVTYFAQQIGDLLTDMSFETSYSEDHDKIYFRQPTKSPQEVSILELKAFNFIDDAGAIDYQNESMLLDEIKKDKKKTVEYIKDLSKFRDKVLYATDSHIPGISRESMEAQLLLNTKLSLGMIWAAIELHREKSPLPAIQRVFRDINEAVKKVD